MWLAMELYFRSHDCVGANLGVNIKDKCGGWLRLYANLQTLLTLTGGDAVGGGGTIVVVSNASGCLLGGWPSGEQASAGPAGGSFSLSFPTQLTWRYRSSPSGVRRMRKTNSFISILYFIYLLFIFCCFYSAGKELVVVSHDPSWQKGNSQILASC